jgi:hypothetical protein
MSVRLPRLRLRPGRKSALAAAAVVAASLTATTLTTPTPASAVTIRGYEQCLTARFKPVGGGWNVYLPFVWESGSTVCNLKYGDLPRRYGPDYVGDPATAIKALQRNLNYCYHAGLVVDGLYGSKTRAAVLRVQRLHPITADGIYGPQTRSAMRWRMYNVKTKVWTRSCYDRL